MLARLWSGVDRTVEVFVALVFLGIVLVGGMQVFSRFFLNASLSWSEEFQKFGHIWIVFLAIPVAYRRGAHIYMDVLRLKFPKKLARVFDLFVDLIWAGFAVAIIVLTWKITKVAAFQTSPGLGIPMSFPYFGVFGGGIYLLLVSLRKIAAWTTSKTEGTPS